MKTDYTINIFTILAIIVLLIYPFALMSGLIILTIQDLSFIELPELSSTFGTNKVSENLFLLIKSEFIYISYTTMVY